MALQPVYNRRNRFQQQRIRIEQQYEPAPCILPGKIVSSGKAKIPVASYDMQPWIFLSRCLNRTVRGGIVLQYYLRFRRGIAVDGLQTRPQMSPAIIVHEKDRQPFRTRGAALAS